MDEIIYRETRSGYRSLSHAYVSPFKQPANIRQLRSSEPSNIRQLRSSEPSNVRQLRTAQSTGPYKSPYYDPVARHERYMRERKSLGIGTGSKIGSSGSGGKSGGSGGKSGGSGGKSRSGSSSSSNSDAAKKLSLAIAKLREESSLDTEAHREATRRKIADLREQISQHIQTLSEQSSGDEETINTAEIRGRIQSLKSDIEKAGNDFTEWAASERTALLRRIAALKGEKYVDNTAAYKRAQEERKQKVNSMADAIYKNEK